MAFRRRGEQTWSRVGCSNSVFFCAGQMESMHRGSLAEGGARPLPGKGLHKAATSKRGRAAVCHSEYVSWKICWSNKSKSSRKFVQKSVPSSQPLSSFLFLLLRQVALQWFRRSLSGLGASLAVKSAVLEACCDVNCSCLARRTRLSGYHANGPAQLGAAGAARYPAVTWADPAHADNRWLQPGRGRLML